jgi:DNA primase
VTVDQLLDRLGGVKPTARGWTARCPAHGDRTPSLSIALGENDRILLYCFAACQPADIVAALSD